MSRAATEEHGYQSASFQATDPASPVNNVQFGVDTSHPLVPQFPVQNGVNIFDSSQYFLTGADVNFSYAPQVNLQAGAGYTQNYTWHDHHGILEFGGNFETYISSQRAMIRFTEARIARSHLLSSRTRFATATTTMAATTSLGR